MYKNIIIITLSLIIALAEISLVWSWPYPFNQISLAIPLIIFMIMFEKKRSVWLGIFVYGMIFDIFTFLPLGTHILIFGLLYALGRFLFYNYLSNPSFLTSFVLTGLLVSLYEAIQHLVRIFEREGGVPMLFQAAEWQDIGVSLIFNLLAISVIYLTYKIIVKIVKPRGLLYGKI
jgi:cell shape-determining protein MreD